MRIKRLTLSDFKSYPGKTVVDFGEGSATVIVGQNGAGKSNLLLAIDFVLGTRNAVLTSQERHRFFNADHERPETYVEIVLEDGQKLPDSQLTIRRVLGIRRDEYYLNGHQLTRAQLTNVLEVMSFSLPSPYFVNRSLLSEFMSPNQERCLNVLIRSMGLGIWQTFVFIGKEFRSIEDFKQRFASLERGIDYSDIENLDAINAKLREYKALKIRRARIRMKMYSLQILEWEEIIREAAENLRTNQLSNIDSAKHNCEVKNAITAKKSDLSKARLEIDILKQLVADSNVEKERILGKREKVVLSIEDVKKEIGTLEAEILMKRASPPVDTDSQTLSELVADFSRKQKQLDDLKNCLAQREQSRTVLLGKIGTLDKHKSAEDRKKWVENEAQVLLKRYKENAEEIRILRLRKDQINRTLSNLMARLEMLDDEVKKFEGAEHTKKNIKEELHRYQAELNELQRGEFIKNNDTNAVAALIDRKVAILRCKIGKSIHAGFESMAKVLSYWSDEGRAERTKCFGTVIENITCSDSLITALSVAVGAKLFYQIVDSNYTGNAVLEEMRKLDLPGEITFIPLNRIQPPPQPQIQSFQNDASPLINSVRFPDAVGNAITFALGNVIVCRNLEVAAQVAKSCRCSCVTLEGDIVRGSGPMSGGHQNPALTVGKVFFDIQHLKQQKEEIVRSIGTIKSKIDTKKMLVHFASSRLHSIQTRLENEAIILEKNSLTTAILSSKDDLAVCIDSIEKKEMDNARLDSEREALLQTEETMIADPESAKFGVIALNKEIIALKKSVNELTADVSEKKSKISLLQTKRHFLTEMDAENVSLELQLNKLRQKLKDYDAKYEMLSSSLNSINQSIAESTSTLETRSLEVEKIKSELSELKEQLNKAIPTSAYLNTSVAHLKMDEYSKKIAEKKKLVDGLTTEFGLQILHEPNWVSSLTLGQLFEELKKLDATINAREEDYSECLRTKKKTLKLRTFRQKSNQFQSEFDKYCEAVGIVRMWLKEYVEHSLRLISSAADRWFKAIVNEGSLTMDFTEHTDPENRPISTAGVAFRVKLSSVPINSLRALSKAQQMAVLLGIVFAFMDTHEEQFAIFDEIDQSFSSPLFDKLLQVISQFSRHQFFISSHRIQTTNQGDSHLLVHFKTGSRLNWITKDEAVEIVRTLNETSSRPSCSFLSSSPQSELATPTRASPSASSASFSSY
ncbi:Structural maintenance of chromosomes [Nesidiocoris tenuis]|uniref:Structural maintenance of chromosomes n=1 Tax=Nesidiocoris tenuis TaxID=355587 RepID=A0ABN7B9B7_9HEMI|nr:Structural maintenance of chromosomes [Nesidiocoris tenuis]